MSEDTVGGELQVIDLKLSTERGLVTANISTLGAVFRSLNIFGTDVVVPILSDEPNPFADGIIMAPWANRIDHGRWSNGDVELQLPINEVALDHAIHGLVQRSHFLVTGHTQSSVTLETEVLPIDGYPFHLQVGIEYALVADGIKITQFITNLGYDLAPVAFGSHPYLQIGDVAVEQLELRTTARQVAIVNERLIPIDTIDIADIEFDIRDWRKVGDLDYNHGFTVFELMDVGNAHHELRAPNGDILDVWQSPEFKHAFIFTPKAYFNNVDPTPRHAIAIEAQTAPANCLNSKRDLIWLEAGKTTSASWGLALKLVVE
jgi:aldose 1-epimerase